MRYEGKLIQKNGPKNGSKSYRDEKQRAKTGPEVDGDWKKTWNENP